MPGINNSNSGYSYTGNVNNSSVDYTVPNESSKQDNLEAIREFNQAIDTYKYEISAYQMAIDETQELISNFERLQAGCEKELESAKIDLKNAYKKKVYVYSEGSGFKQVTDEKAVSKAQETVDYYEYQVERCRINKEECQKMIEEYRIEISARESQIAICQAAIVELM